MKQPMLVIHVAWSPRTGILSFITYLARWQAEQEGVVVRTAFFGSDRAYLGELDEMMRSQGLSGRMFRCLPTPFHRLVLLGDRRLQRYVEEQTAAVGASRVVVHIHEARLSAMFLPLTAADGSQIHVVATFHGFSPERIKNRNPLKRLLHLWMAKRLAQSGATCVSVSAAEIPELTEGLRYRPEMFTVIHNGVPRPAEQVEHRRDESRRMRVGYVGMFVDRKRWWLVGEGVERARELGADCEVVFAGGQGNVKELVEWVRQRPDFASYVGEVRDAGTCLVPTLDVVVLPSRQEGLPMILLEAFAAGVPVIATAVGGVPELVSSGSNGFLVEPTAEAIAQRIVELYEKPSLYSAIAAQARATFQNRFTTGACGRRYLELYLAGLPEGGSPVLRERAKEVSDVSTG
jgi:glycosyltransferase involved in cell wall biosynthesis